MPTKAFAGDLQLLELNLRNHSEYAVKVGLLPFIFLLFLILIFLEDLLSFLQMTITLCNYQSPFYLLTRSNPVMQGIKMKISNPRFVIAGDSPDIGLEFPHCLKKHTQSEIDLVPHKSTKQNFKGLLFAFPQVRWFMALSFLFIFVLE